jgi:hypothetical protein
MILKTIICQNNYPSTIDLNAISIGAGSVQSFQFVVSQTITSSTLTSTTTSGIDNYNIRSIYNGATTSATFCFPGVKCTIPYVISTSENVQLLITCNNPINPCRITGSISFLGRGKNFYNVLVPSYTYGKDSLTASLDSNANTLSVSMAQPSNVGSTQIIAYEVTWTDPNLNTITGNSTTNTFRATGNFVYGDYTFQYRVKNLDGFSSWNGPYRVSFLSIGSEVGIAFLVIFLTFCCCLVLMTPCIVLGIIVGAIILTTGSASGICAYLCASGVRGK